MQIRFRHNPAAVGSALTMISLCLDHNSNGTVQLEARTGSASAADVALIRSLRLPNTAAGDGAVWPVPRLRRGEPAAGEPPRGALPRAVQRGAVMSPPRRSARRIACR